MYSLVKRDKKLVDKSTIKIQNIFMQTLNFGNQIKRYKCRDTQGNQKVLSNFPPKKYSIKAQSVAYIENKSPRSKTISVSGKKKAQHMSILDTKIDPYTEDQYLYKKKQNEAKTYRKSVKSKREDTQEILEFEENPIKIQKIDVNPKRKELYIEMFYRSRGKKTKDHNKELQALLISALERRKSQNIALMKKKEHNEPSKLRRKRPPRIGSAPNKATIPLFELSTPTPWKIATPAIATPF